MPLYVRYCSLCCVFSEIQGKYVCRSYRGHFGVWVYRLCAFLAEYVTLSRRPQSVNHKVDAWYFWERSGYLAQCSCVPGLPTYRILACSESAIVCSLLHVATVQTAACSMVASNIFSLGLDLRARRPRNPAFHNASVFRVKVVVLLFELFRAWNLWNTRSSVSC